MSAFNPELIGNYDTESVYGIPILDLSMQAESFGAVDLWNSRRKQDLAGTLVFYTEDWRYEGIWQRPSIIRLTQADSFVEPNYSIYADSPLALVLWQTYKKRYAARYWQSLGLRCFVDLNVHPDFYVQNFLGVPKGWRAYATRGYENHLESLDDEYCIACNHAERADSEDILFMVYGGGDKVKKFCLQRGYRWYAEAVSKLSTWRKRTMGLD